MTVQSVVEVHEQFVYTALTAMRLGSDTDEADSADSWTRSPGSESSV
jgi:hypothetical protein